MGCNNLLFDFSQDSLLSQYTADAQQLYEISERNIIHRPSKVFDAVISFLQLRIVMLGNLEDSIFVVYSIHGLASSGWAFNSHIMNRNRHRAWSCRGNPHV